MLNSIQLANHACAAIDGYLVRMCEIVRRYAKEHRRDQPPKPRNLRRIVLPIAHPTPTPSNISPPTLAQSMDELLSSRKRKSHELLSPMSRVKRRDHGCNKSSPWSEDTWAQQLATNVDIKLDNTTSKHYKKWNRRKLPRKSYSLHGIRYQRPPSPKIVKPYRISLHPHRPDHFEQAYKNLCAHDPLERFHTPRRSPSSEPYTTPDEYQSGREMSDEHDPLQLDIDEDVLQDANFAFVQPEETADDIDELQRDSDDQSEEQKEESDWDEEGDIEHRKMLRSLPESYDEEGFRVAIDGVISPESKLWNDEHRRKLHECTALEQQTPSKPPKYISPSLLPKSPNSPEPPHSLSLAISASENSLEVTQPGSPNAADSNVPNHATKEEVGQENQLTTPISIRKTPSEEHLKEAYTSLEVLRPVEDTMTNGDTAAIKAEETHDTRILKTPPYNLIPELGNNNHAETAVKDDETEEKKVNDVPEQELPLFKLQNLSLVTPAPRRTPKSGTFSEVKTDRTTRRKARLAEIEAAKNAYPLVPLSKNWEEKVRHAVNHGHGRFEASMFNKCVPEYSTDPTARSLWLDDAVINDYVAMVAKHGSKDDRKDQVRSVAALSSFFFTKISSGPSSYASCSGMLRRAGIQGKKLLDCEKVFIPINRAYHWTLAVIEPKIPEGATHHTHPRKLTIYNSMGSSGGHAVAQIIMSWIKHELGASYHEDEWLVDPAGDSPQQRNTDDCGVFTCTTARQIMLRKYEDVKGRYKEGDIWGMRRRIVAELVNGGLLSGEESRV